ncbi:hypothetical protein KAK07_23060 [Ideonella sp. 4Y16]|uniref:hypothetical protein n=1 Tax=Ideonella alba TaxID=2824118 RepID=UPI001B3942E1|nr:hypothetical protein [Ideonella alba]MBQ0946238.1 hypothetical protein [Ideonella alba]
MADKILTEAEWKKFAKGRTVKDAALLKAMAELGKAERAGPDAVLKALDELEKQADALAKAHKADKEVASQVADIGKAVAKQRKLSEQEAKAAAKAQEEAEDDESSPAQLTTKLIPLMREVRKGNPMHALIALGGPLAAVLLSRRPITASSRKLLAGEFDGGSIKYFPAQCIFEANSHTFVLETLPAGIAKKLKAALLKQTEQRYKVRARGADPNEVDDDGDLVEPDDLAEDSADAPRSRGEALAAHADDEPDTGDTATRGSSDGERTDTPTDTSPDTPSDPVADPEQVRFDARLREMRASIERFAASGVAEVAKLKPLLDFATGKAAEGLHRAAHQGLDAVAKLIEKAAPKVGAESATAAGDGMTGFKSRITELTAALKTALDAGRDGAAEQRARMAQAVAAAGKQAFDQAHGLLDEVEAWLGTAAASAGGGLVALQQSRLALDGLRQRVSDQLDALEQAVIEQVRAHNADADNEDEFDEAELTAGLRRLHTLLDRLDTRLIDKLDEALSASGADRQQRHREAQAIVTEYRSFVGSDPLIAQIDANGFLDTAIRREAEQTLTQLAERLQTA